MCGLNRKGEDLDHTTKETWGTCVSKMIGAPGWATCIQYSAWKTFFFYFTSTIASVLENLTCKHRGANKNETFHTNFLTPHGRCSKLVTKTRSNQTEDEFNECTWVIRDFYSIILLYTFYELIRRSLGSHNNHQRNSLKVRECRLMSMFWSILSLYA
jgi:hypothetical protein